MKLKTKPKYFRKIKSGEKLIDYRSAHVTFVNEESGAKFTRKVKRTYMICFDELPRDLQKSAMFDVGEPIIAFELEDEM
jgi:hypothetical protein